MIDTRSLFCLSDVDLNELRIFADWEIASGRYLNGARLRHLLDMVPIAAKAEALNAEKAKLLSDASKLATAIANSKIELDLLIAEIQGVFPGLESIFATSPVSRAGIRAATARADIASARAFYGALTEVTKKLEKISESLEGHIEDVSAWNEEPAPKEQQPTELKKVAP